MEIRGSEEHKITQHEIDNYRRSKNTKRTQRNLIDSEVIQFAELLAKNASSFEYEKLLNLTALDIEFQKRKLGINDMFEAQDFLRSLKASKNLIKEEKTMSTEIDGKSYVTEAEATIKNRYNSIAHYETVTGKRFRLTKEQMKQVSGKSAKERKVVRDKIFREMYGD
jgi:hypothetical protein